jgi:hypothetical protein
MVSLNHSTMLLYAKLKIKFDLQMSKRMKTSLTFPETVQYSRENEELLVLIGLQSYPFFLLLLMHSYSYISDC